MEKTLEILIFTFVVLLGIRFFGDLILDFLRGRGKRTTRESILAYIKNIGRNIKLIGCENGNDIYTIDLYTTPLDSIEDIKKYLTGFAFDAKSFGLSFDWIIKDSVLTIKLE